MATLAESWAGTGGLVKSDTLQEIMDLMSRAYLNGPWELPPEELARQLREVDPYLRSDILQSLAWETIGGYGQDTTDERQRAVKESVRLYKYSPLAQWAIWLWGGWGLGDHVEIVPNDEGAAEAWDEFWTADRNACVLADDRIHELSNWLLVRGNRFLAFYGQTVDGQVTVRRLNQDQLTILANPDDDYEPWFYKRQWAPAGRNPLTWYYPDWQIFFGGDLEDRWEAAREAYGIPESAVRADRRDGQQLGGENPGTEVCVLHVAHNIKDESSLWGWPITTASRPWLTAHNRFVEARLSVAMAVAMFVRRKKVAGGSRGVDAIQRTIDSRLSPSRLYDTNPPAPAGSVEIENQAVDTTDLPLRTGASDAKADHEMFTWQPLLGMGLFPTTAGLDTSRWATALEMDKAQSMLFEQYQTFWSAQFRRMVQIVLSYQEKYKKGTYEDKGAEVSVDTFSLADFKGVAGAIGGMVSNAMTPLVDNGTIPASAARDIARTLWRVSLQALGVDQASDLTGEEEWEPEEEEEEEPKGEVPPQLQPFVQPGAAPPGEETVVQQIAAMIEAETRDGYMDWQKAAEWALETLRERHGN